jgi:pyruvate dehydrogenase E1 component alpha subunit/2-oxoisovalerate dehydrogenase E1 component alpha subunit
VYDVTKEAVDRARRGEGVTLIELMTYRRKGHAEHDNQSYVPAGEIERWAAENDPIDRYVRVLREQLQVSDTEIAAIDARIVREIDEATDIADASPLPQALDALRGVYADRASEPPLWFRRDSDAGAYGAERADGWGTWSVDGSTT